MEKFPKNFKEAIIASVPNALVMVVCMVALNLWIYGALSWGHFIGTVGPMFAVAFLYDFFVVGPLVTRFVKRHGIMRAMPFIRVGVMAGTLTFVAPIIESGVVISAQQYIAVAPRNYLAALALQICAAMPLGLFVLSRARRIMIK